MPAAAPRLQGLGDEGESAPRGHQLAHVQAPGRIEVVDHPVIAGHGRELLLHVGQMRREVLTGAGAPEIPQHLPGGHHEGRKQDSCAMADVLMLPFLRLPRLGRLCGIFSLQNLHPGLFVCADHQAAVFVVAQGVAIQLTNIPRFRVKRRIVTIEPIDTAMWFEVRCLQNPPQARTTHEPAWMLLPQDEQHGVEAPARGPARGGGG